MPEGEDEVKSLWPLWIGQLTCYSDKDKV